MEASYCVCLYVGVGLTAMILFHKTMVEWGLLFLTYPGTRFPLFLM